MTTPQDPTQFIYDSMLRFEQEMITYSEAGRHIAKRTIRIVRSVIILLTIIAVIIFVLIGNLTNSMVYAIGNMVYMYERFGTMSGDMKNITKAVTSISNNVGGLPAIAKEMVAMDQAVVGMAGDVTAIKTNITRMDDTVLTLGMNVQEMASRFESLNHSVYVMRYNVNRMSSPLMGPRLP
ncbi:conserved hypothetical protein [Gammaproteobacteria bacterium]